MATISCPHCAKSLDLPADVAGKTVHCPSCEKVFTPSASAVASGEPPAKSTNPNGAMTEKAPASKTGGDRDADDFGVPRERHDIAKKSSSMTVPIILIVGAAMLGICVCAAPIFLFLGFMPVAMHADREEAVAVAKAEAAHADAMEQVGKAEGLHKEAFAKGTFEARDAIAQGKLLLKEYPPLPAPGWHGEYIKLLKEKCKCDYVVIGEPNLPNERIAEIDGWNTAMRAELQQRHGANILGELNKEAEQRWHDRVKANGKK